MTKAKHPIEKKVSQHQQTVIFNAILTLWENLISGKQHFDQPFHFWGYDDGGLKRFLSGTCYTPRSNITVKTMECLCNKRLARMKDTCAIELTAQALNYFLANYKRFSWYWPELSEKINAVVAYEQELMCFLTKWDKEGCGGLTPALLFLEAEGWTTELSSFLSLRSPFQALMPPDYFQWEKMVPRLEVAVWREYKTRTHPEHKVVHLLRYYGEPVAIIAQQKSTYQEYILDKELFYRTTIAFMEAAHDSAKDMALDTRLEERILFPKPENDLFNPRSYTWKDMKSITKEKSDR